MNVFQTVFNLYQWSTNFPCGEGPFTLFCDMIGWSEEALGENLVTEPNWNHYGYKELSLLALALEEYTDSPSDVKEYVQFLLDCELEGVDVEDTSPEVTELCRKALEACYCVS